MQQWSPFKFWISGCLILAFACALPRKVKEGSGPGPSKVVRGCQWNVSEAIDGSIAILKCDQTVSRAKLAFEGQEIQPAVFRELVIYLVPISFNSQPRSVTPQLVGVGIGPALKITAGVYNIENISVEAKYVDPPAKLQKRIAREQIELGNIYKHSADQSLWRGNFDLPVQSDVTSPFGNKRMYNGQMRNFHAGLDLKAAVGTRILAPESGKVVLAKDLYFTGNTVIVDHGLGLFTIYAHLSKIKTKLNHRISKGELIGLAGATGRVSGPHLHWGVKLQGEKVNPLDLTKIF